MPVAALGRCILILVLTEGPWSVPAPRGADEVVSGVDEPSGPTARGDGPRRSGRITVEGGTPRQHARLAAAVRRFGDLGMVLPDLRVTFADDRARCRGHHGLFRRGATPWRITLCSDLDWVHAHELAHAWEAANVTAEQRSAFMRMRGYAVWSDRDVSWHRRGMEGAAVVIQQGLDGPPLPSTLSAEHRSRLSAFRLLTGSPDPRLESWARDRRTSGIRGSGPRSSDHALHPELRPVRDGPGAAGEGDRP